MFDLSVVRLISLTCLALLPTTVQALSETYCSSSNTGSSFAAVNSIYNSVLYCQQTCSGGGYAYAVLQDQNCWCSNYTPSNQVALSSCSDTCPGYPSDSCGNAANALFSYVALGPAASAAVTQASTVLVTSVNVIVSTKTNTVVQQNTVTNNIVTSMTLLQTVTVESAVVTSIIVSVPVTVVASAASTAASAAASSKLSAALSSSVDALTSVIASSAPTSRPAGASASLQPTTFTQIQTVSGAVITQYITTTPTANSQASQPGLTEHDRSGLSGGAIAGIVIGSLIGGLLLGLLLFFFLCWRPRHDDDDEGGEKGLSRNASVLSRAGLLGIFRAGSASTRNNTPKIGVAANGRPISGAASSHLSEATFGSRAVHVDSRLNPAALMPYGNTSQTSVGTLQDGRDYSRPLEVRNPD